MVSCQARYMWYELSINMYATIYLDSYAQKTYTKHIYIHRTENASLLWTTKSKWTYRHATKIDNKIDWRIVSQSGLGLASTVMGFFIASIGSKGGKLYSRPDLLLRNPGRATSIGIGSGTSIPKSVSDRHERGVRSRAMTTRVEIGGGRRSREGGEESSQSGDVVCSSGLIRDEAAGWRKCDHSGEFGHVFSPF
jgi:hypothetical protein